MDEISLFLRAIADPRRLKLLRLVASRELCVCDLAQILGISQPAVSQQCKRLKDVGLISERREGQWVYYRANPVRLKENISALERFFAEEPRGMAAELERLHGCAKKE